MPEELIAIAAEQSKNLKFPFPYAPDKWVGEMDLLVENFHKHTTWSDFFQIDSATSIGEFMQKGDERGVQCMFSGEHGYQGEWMYVYDCCASDKFQKDNSLNRKQRFRYSVEAYWVKDRSQSDNTNCHMVIVARNYEAIRKMNYIISEANANGYYYKPRIDLDLLFTLSPEDVYITSACVAGWKYEDADDIWLQIWRHFGDSFFFEYQAHNTEKQKELNAHIHELSAKYGIQTIIGLDTHYISDEDRVKRDNLLLRKGLHYDDEDGWYMDWPTGSELLERMREQGVLSDEEIIRSMMNTHVFVNGCEDITLNTDFKIPVLPQYAGFSYEQRVAELKHILNEAYANEEQKSPERLDGLRYEVGQIDESGIADYFLVDHAIVKTATSPEYGGQLTTTSRGSMGSYYTNKLLGLTTLDRFEAEVPIYPERFMTKERIAASHSCADADLNCGKQEPFVKASKDLLGEHCCYPLLAVGKLKEKNAFKLYAAINNVDPQTANEITTRIDQYNEALKNVDDDDKYQIDIEDYIKDPTLLRLYRESKAYQNIIEQAKVHACGHLLFNGDGKDTDVIGYGDIRYEVGLIRCVSESTKKSVLVACVEGGLLDAYGYVKNDYLIVDVVSIIHRLFESIGNPVPSVAELRQMVDGDAATWDLYAKGATCCLNQCERRSTMQKVMQYKPQNIKELSAFIASIRPGFKSLLDGFLQRNHYTNGEPAIDEMLQDSFHYMLYQEATMKLFQYLGIPMKDAYDTIKSISKKKLVGEQLKRVEDTLREHWLENIGNLDNFDSVYQVIKDSARYSFNGPHALSMAFDSLYEAWFKAHHPDKFYEVVLNHYQSKGDKDKISDLVQEAKVFFGYTMGEYCYGLDHTQFRVDGEQKIIYPSLASIKGIGEQAATDLRDLSAKKLTSMLDILQNCKGTKINKTVLSNLAKIGYFSPFGSVKQVLETMRVYDYWIGTGDGRKRIAKKGIGELGLQGIDLSQFATDVLASGKISATQYTITDIGGLINAIVASLPDEEYPSTVLAKFQYEVLGDISVVDETADKRICVAMNYDDKYSPKFVGYCISTGRRQEIKVHKKKDGRNPNIKCSFDSAPFEDGDLIYLRSCSKRQKSKRVGDKWVKIPGTVEWWADDYSVIK